MHTIPKTYSCFETKFEVKTAPKDGKFTSSLFCYDCGRTSWWSGSGAVSELLAAQAAMGLAYDHCERYHEARVKDIRSRPFKQV